MVTGERSPTHIDIPKIYPAGHLDRDSEGLLLTTDDGKLHQHIADPEFKLEKHYWAQVHAEVSDESSQTLCRETAL